MAEMAAARATLAGTEAMPLLPTAEMVATPGMANPPEVRGRAAAAVPSAAPLGTVEEEAELEEVGVRELLELEGLLETTSCAREAVGATSSPAGGTGFYSSF